MMQTLQERLIRYAKIDTQADMTSTTTPTTPGQLELANMLVNELKSIGLSDVSINDNGHVMATLPSNTEKKVPTIGFLAHLDTAMDFTGNNVNPQLTKDYDGGDIILNNSLNITLSPRDFPNLKNYVGHDLITTDGTTLLGADNKAGIAEIITAMEFLSDHPEIKHGDIRIAFTPDEEIGRGPHNFDVKRFNATFAYTIDGGSLGELQFECFNAASAFITFNGNNVHPGKAKDVMVHSGKIAMEFHSRLPAELAPELTEGYEGFFHLIEMTSLVEKTDSYYIIRDFDKDLFAEKKELVAEIVSEFKEKYGESAVELKMEDSYYNMAEKIKPVHEVIEIAQLAMKNLGITPISEPIRGGTDGSQLSYMGLPTPNLFTGGENFHSKYEFASLNVMEKATMTIVEIIKLFERRP